MMLSSVPFVCPGRFEEGFSRGRNVNINQIKVVFYIEFQFEIKHLHLHLPLHSSWIHWLHVLQSHQWC